MVEEARESCTSIISKGAEPDPLLNIAFSHHALSAWPLFEILRGMVWHMIADPNTAVTDNDRAHILYVLKIVSASYEAMARKRNELVHATWYIGYGKITEDEGEMLPAYKYRGTKGGFSRVEMPKNVKELERLSKECELTQMILGLLSHCVTDYTETCVEENLNIERITSDFWKYC